MLITGPIALDSLPPIPWKNGGGITRTIAVEPASAGLDNFLWRISMADLHSSGAFSNFPGVDRTILLWRGAGLKLSSSSWPDQILTEASQPFIFAGEDDVSCELQGGPSQDLNLMVRRGAVNAALNVSSEAVRLTLGCNDLIVFCAQGSVTIHLGDSQEYALEAGYFLRIFQPQAEAVITPAEDETRFAYVSTEY